MASDKLNSIYPFSHFMADFLSAAGASFAISPAVTVIDRSIIQNAAGAKTMRKALADGFSEMMIRPHDFVRRADFLMIFGLYYITYQVAHTFITIGENTKTDVSTSKFITTSIVNCTACVAKDSQFTRMFGVKAPTALPISTYCLFLARDSCSMFASFTLPSVAADKLVGNFNMSYEKAINISQFSCPLAIQFVSTPLHLLGLNLYNAPKATPKERLLAIKRQYFSSALARCSRTLPAFSIGGILCRKFRLGLREKYPAPERKQQILQES